MPFIDFQSRVVQFDRVTPLPLFRECTPKILVVTDGFLNYNPSDGFGLSVFVNTLSSMSLHGMTPVVTTAYRAGTSALAAISNFTFDHATQGLLISRYDVVFILSFNRTASSPISASEVDAIARFMQAGGGVFATGDHEDLGASVGLNIPRVRAMRFWSAATTPHVSNPNRLSTNISGTDETEEFSDQSDRQAQRLYPNFRTLSGGLGAPHPLLQMPAPGRVIEVFPDHPHEGECTVPSNLSTVFSLDGVSHPEWPVAALTGAALPPEAVARSMSYGDGFPSGPTGPKAPLEPRSFVPICAWDGQQANRGRVVTDSTWHHFINVNLDGTASGLPAPINGLATPELDRVKQYYRNLATWLMPKTVRRCLRYPLLVAELARYPLVEELRLPRQTHWTAPLLHQVGASVVAALRNRYPQWVVEDLLEEVLVDAGGDALRVSMGDTMGAMVVKTAALSALGGFVASLATVLEKSKVAKDLAPHGRLEKESVAGAGSGLKLVLGDTQREIETLAQSMKRVALA